MLLNTVVERNLKESKCSPKAGSNSMPAIYIINTNSFPVLLKAGETLGTPVRLRTQDEGGEQEPEGGGQQRSCPSCSCA